MLHLGVEDGASINYMVEVIHRDVVKAGWWNDKDFGSLKEGPILKYIVPTKMALIDSEVAEALEGFRKNMPDEKLPHRKAVEVELADAIIRIFDLAGALGLDLGGAMIEKLAFNKTRLDHSLEHRGQENGKKF